MSRRDNTAALIGVAGGGALLAYLLRRPRAGVSLAPMPAPAGAVPELGQVAQLGEPITTPAPHRVTPHGHYGADRAGPPVHKHEGVDLVAAPGSNVLAVGDGQIVPAQPGLGKVVLKLALDRPGRWSPAGELVSHVVYADLGQPLVKAGDRVRAGDPIAKVWREGFVHFATKIGTGSAEKFFDPLLAGFQYRSDAAGILVARNARGPAPYELTRDEFKRRELERARAAVEPREEPRPGKLFMYSRREHARLDEAAREFQYISRPGVLDEQHQRAVVEALRARRTVPASVLADYPELAGEDPAPLSHVVDAINDANEPPDGFSDADLVRNAAGDDLTVANTIRDQLGRQALLMLGASNLAGDGESLQFAIKGSRTVNRIRIILTPDDLYSLEFWKVRGTDFKKVSEAEGIYADQLLDVIEEHTGLYTRLVPRQANDAGGDVDVIEGVEQWIARLGTQNPHYAYGYDVGPVYLRVWFRRVGASDEDGRSVVAFVERATGIVRKAHSWKKAGRPRTTIAKIVRELGELEPRQARPAKTIEEIEREIKTTPFRELSPQSQTVAVAGREALKYWPLTRAQMIEQLLQLPELSFFLPEYFKDYSKTDLITRLLIRDHDQAAAGGQRQARAAVPYFVTKIATDPPTLYRVERDNGGTYLLLQPVDADGNPTGAAIQDRYSLYERVRRRPRPRDADAELDVASLRRWALAARLPKANGLERLDAWADGFRGAGRELADWLAGGKAPESVNDVRAWIATKAPHGLPLRDQGRAAFMEQLRAELGLPPLPAPRNASAFHWRASHDKSGKLAPWWVELRGRNGVYLIRDVATHEMQYVGESHRNRLYGTASRHIQNWNGPGSGPSFRPRDVEIAYELHDDPEEAIARQFELIQQYSPVHNVQDGHTLALALERSGKYRRADERQPGGDDEPDDSEPRKKRKPSDDDEIPF